MINIIEIHKTRPLTLEECEELLNVRRMYGDLRPEFIEREQREFFKSLKELEK